MQSQRLALAFGASVFFSSLASAQTWQTLAPFPAAATPRQFATALNAGNALWIVGGTPLTSGGDAAVHKYYPLYNSLVTSALPLEGGAIHGGVALDGLGRILVFSGIDSGGAEGDYYVWTEADGNNGGFAARSGQAPKTYFALATDDEGRVYSVGGGPGATATSGNQNKSRVERYTATTNSWQVLAPLPTPVADAAACYDGNGHILVIGGHGATGARSANVAAYDIENNVWSDTEIADFPVPVSGARAVRGVDERIYVIGGNAGAGALRTTWILDAGATTWRPGPDLAVAREGAACVLGNDDYVYVFGGASGVGATTNEKLLTPRCPRIDVAPVGASRVLGQPIGFVISVSGAAPFTYRWRHDGMDMYDGVQFNGSAVSGATTPSLGVTSTNAADAGSYECVVTNACGSTTTDAVVVSFTESAALPTNFASRSLHPANTNESRALAIDGNRIGGEATYPTPPYNDLNHPFVWDEQRLPTDWTPPTSVGGVVNAMRGSAIVGWFWWPYYTPQGTGYYQHACAYTSNAVVTDLQPQGWEVGTIQNTDGVHHVGYALYDPDHSIAVDGVYWASSAPFSYTMLTSGGDLGVSGANVGAIEDGQLFGVKFGVTPYGAVAWSQNASSAWQPLSVNPATSNASYIQDADSGQQVGRAKFGLETHAGLWGGSSGAFVDLNPAGSTNSEANATRQGIQVGFATFTGSGSRAMAWKGTAASALDLHAFSPGGFTYEVANDLEIDAFGTVTIVGQGSNTGIVPQRTEALEWRGNPQALSTDTQVASATNGCTLRYTLFGGPQNAGRAWKLYPAASRGLAPGSHAVQLPPISGVFDAMGFASAHIDVPAGAVASPVKVSARYLVRAAGGALVLSSNVVTISVAP